MPLLIVYETSVCRHPHTTLLTDMQDSHVYVCRHFVFHLLRGLDHLESFREDFVPWMCKTQYQVSKRQKCLERKSIDLPALSHQTQLIFVFQC